MSNLLEQVKNLPDNPGVYTFKDEKGEILYIGKATSLRDRVRSYFSDDIEFVRSPLIAKMVSTAKEIFFEQTNSVLEALILEANLIKKHQPVFNVKEKDDRSFNYVAITKEEFPRVLTVRGRDLDKKLTALPAQAGKTLQPASSADRLKAVFGPFPHGKELQDALKIIRKIFPFHDGRSRSSYGERFYREIGLAPNTKDELAKKEYSKTIKNIILFFNGNKRQIIKNLQTEMRAFAKKREFEKADEVKRKIFALNHIQDVALIREKSLPVEGADNVAEGFRIESYDIAHMSGKNVVGVMVVVENGTPKKSEYRKFNIKQNPGVDDTGALREVLARRFNHQEWKFPDVVAVDGGVAQKNVAEKVLAEMELNIPVVAVTKNNKHKPDHILGDIEIIEKYKKEVLLGNHESHRYAIAFHRKKREKLK